MPRRYRGHGKVTRNVCDRQRTLLIKDFQDLAVAPRG
jgi:hypothetical protein